MCLWVPQFFGLCGKSLRRSLPMLTWELRVENTQNQMSGHQGKPSAYCRRHSISLAWTFLPRLESTLFRERGCHVMIMEQKEVSVLLINVSRKISSIPVTILNSPQGSKVNLGFKCPVYISEGSWGSPTGSDFLILVQVVFFFFL